MIQPIIAGNRLNWWERSDDMEFTNRTACLKDQYSTFTIEHGGRNYSLDRSSQQGENIADNGAAKLAYRYVSVMVLLPSFSLPSSLLKLQRCYMNAMYIRSFLSSPPGRRDECLPDVPLSSRQLYWLGFALDWCTMSNGYREYSTYTRMLSREVVSDRKQATLTCHLNIAVLGGSLASPMEGERSPGQHAGVCHRFQLSGRGQDEPGSGGEVHRMVNLLQYKTSRKFGKHCTRYFSAYLYVHKTNMKNKCVHLMTKIS